jgi:RNA polymerase sigma-70 factor (ECF subfamily)
MDPQERAADPRDTDVELGRAWRDHRRHLLDIGFRMLGNLSDAEDAVQEAFARLVQADIDEIDDVGGWLVVVVSRICLDRLRAERRHPTSPDATLGDRPATAAVDPADRVTLDDNVRIALDVVLRRLSPAERTAFVLHDVFQYSFEAVGEIVGRTPAACRQLASRARRAIRTDTSATRFHVESAEQRRVTEQFIAACASGDLNGLLAILDPHVVGGADVGGAVGTVVVTGRDNVVRQLMRYVGPDSSTTLLTLPGGDHSGLVGIRRGRCVVMLELTVRDGLVEHIDGLVDPAKLAPIAHALGL